MKMRSTFHFVSPKCFCLFLEIIEDGPSGTEPMESQLIAPQSTTTQKNQEKESFKKLGLTKEVLAVHTQKEEQSFLTKCKEIKRFHIFQYNCSYYFQERPKGQPGNRGTALFVYSLITPSE